MNKFRLPIIILLWTFAVQAQTLGIKKSSETISFFLKAPIDSAYGIERKPDSVHIETYADNASAATYTARSTTYPFSDVSIDTLKTWAGDTTYVFADAIGDIDGAGGNFVLAIQVTMFTGKYPMRTRETVQVIADSLAELLVLADSANYMNVKNIDGTAVVDSSGHIAVSHNTGSVASVTGNVGGNVTGSVGSIASGGISSGSFAIDAITGNAIAAGAIGPSEVGTGAVDADAVAADAVEEIVHGTWGHAADSAWAAGSFGDSAKGWGATAASALDSTILSNVLHRIVWGTAVGSGSDSSTAAQRDIGYIALSYLSNISDSIWKAILEDYDGVAGSFGDSAQGWGATAASALDSTILSNILHRIVWGTAVGSGSDSSTAAQRDIGAVATGGIEFGDIDIRYFASTIGIIEDSSGNTALMFQTDLSESTDDAYNWGTIVFITGNHLGQARPVSDYVATGGILQVRPGLYGGAPNAGDSFAVIYPMGSIIPNDPESTIVNLYGGYVGPDLDHTQGQLDSNEFADDYYHAIAVASDSGAAATVDSAEIARSVWDNDVVALANRDANVASVDAGAIQFGDIDIRYSNSAIVGTIEDSSGNTALIFQTDLSESTDDAYNWGTIAFITGNHLGQVRPVSDYTGASGVVQVRPGLYGGAPNAGDSFVVTLTTASIIPNDPESTVINLYGGYVGLDFDSYQGQLDSNEFADDYYHAIAVASDSGWQALGDSIRAVFGDSIPSLTEQVWFGIDTANIDSSGLGVWLVNNLAGGAASLPDSVVARIDSILTSLGYDTDDVHGKLDALSGGAGAYQCTVYVYNTATSVMVPSAKIWMENASGTDLAVATTNDAGYGILKVNAGTVYKYMQLTGYVQTTDPETTTVSAAYTDTIEVTAYDPGSPTAGGTGRLYGWIYNSSGSARSGVIVEAEITSDFGTITYGSVTITPFQVVDTTDSDGYWFLDLYKYNAVSDTTLWYQVTAMQEPTTEVPGGTIFKVKYTMPDSTQHLMKFSGAYYEGTVE